MGILFPDTDPKAEAVLVNLWRSMPPWKKLHMVGEMNATVRHLAMIGLRQRHPGASERELKRRLAGLLLGEELATKAYGPLIEGK